MTAVIASSAEALAKLLEFLAGELRQGTVESVQVYAGDTQTRVTVLFTDPLVAQKLPPEVEVEED